MTAQHTPGPWHVNGERSIWAKNDRVAKMDQADGGGETLANAQLIAAAPELLEACELALEALTVTAEESVDGSRMAATARVAAKRSLRTVIAKARGQ